MAQTPSQDHWLSLRKQGAAARDILRHFGVQRPPVDVFSLAQRMGVQVVEVAQPGWSGAVKSSEDGSAVIWLDQSESTIRKRFTVAHEIGHLMLDPIGVAHRDASFSGSRAEVRANNFAADLLMPLEMLDVHVSRVSVNKDELRQLFGVSQLALDIRLGKWGGKS